MSTGSQRDGALSGHDAAVHPLVHTVASRQHGVVTRRDLHRAGIGDQEIRTRVARGEWVRLRRGAYVSARVLAAADTPARRHLLLCWAAVLTLDRPSAVVAGTSAAALWGLPLPARSLDRVTLADPRQSCRGQGLRMTMAPLPPGSCVVHRGLPVTSLARTVADCARTEPFESALVVADAARWDDRLTAAELSAVVDGMNGWRGAAGARLALDLSRAGVESPLETRSRLRLVSAGIPEPQLLMTIRVGGRVLEVDGWWDDAGIAMECDGRIKYRDPWGGRTTEEAHWAEKRRSEIAVAAGVRFWRVADEDLRTEASWAAAMGRLQAMRAHPLPGPRRFTVVAESRRSRRAG